jgi:uncharacterized membrane protein YdcZ (DUF606 family)
VGAGFGLGVYQFTKRSLKNLLSYSCWLIGFYHIFMLVRSKKRNPNYYLELHLIFTIFLLPFFGGLVGAIAITRVEKGNPIPGVAIASTITPLCTAGYGLALGGYKFFFRPCICIP